MRDAIERLAFRTASRKLEEFQRFWPVAKLTWEPELIRIGSEWDGRSLDLDSGHRVWEKLESRLGPLGLSRSRVASIRRHADRIIRTPAPLIWTFRLDTSNYHDKLK